MAARPKKRKDLYCYAILKTLIDLYPASTCLDTGASKSAINSSLVDRWNLHKYVRACTPKKLRGVTGQLSINRQLHCDVVVPTFSGDRTTQYVLSIKAYIVDNLPVDLLLGMDIIKGHSLVIDFRQDLITFRNNTCAVVDCQPSLTPHMNFNTTQSTHVNKETEQTGPFGAVFWGDDHTRRKMINLVSQYSRLFEDDGKVANSPEEEWMVIPLKPDWEKL